MTCFCLKFPRVAQHRQTGQQPAQVNCTRNVLNRSSELLDVVERLPVVGAVVSVIAIMRSCA